MKISAFNQARIISVFVMVSLHAVADTPVDTQSSTQKSAGIQQLPDFPSLEYFDEVTERTLFSASRKPPEKVISRGGGNEQTFRQAWKLTGVTITKDKSLALFEERNGSKRLRLEVGMAIDDRWVVSAVEADYVSIESGAKTVRLALRQPREPLVLSAENNGGSKTAITSDNRSANPGSSNNPVQQQSSQPRKVQTM